MQINNSDSWASKHNNSGEKKTREREREKNSSFFFAMELTYLMSFFALMITERNTDVIPFFFLSIY